jgi:RNA polymerase sigma factor (sigma-70 family)
LPENGDKIERDDQADLELVEAIRNKKAYAWAIFIEKYQGRLLNFAVSKLHQRADAEDVIQDTFVSFIQGLDSYRSEGSIENYLFTILRNKIISRYRNKSTGSVSLIQDVYCSAADGDEQDVMMQIPAVDSSEIWIESRSEQRRLQQEILAQSLLKLCQNFKSYLKFRNLKILELLLYCGLSTAAVSELLKIEEASVRVFKHRCLKQLHENIESLNATPDFSYTNIENLLKEVWESRRLTCPKRSTLGAFLLEQLDPEWFDYIDFHLTTLGCHFCRANLKDLKQKKTIEELQFRERIMASTVGFLCNQ